MIRWCSFLLFCCCCVYRSCSFVLIVNTIRLKSFELSNQKLSLHLSKYTKSRSLNLVNNDSYNLDDEYYSITDFHPFGSEIYSNVNSDVFTDEEISGKYMFDETFIENSLSSTCNDTPTYLLSSILAGLNRLPSEKVLKRQQFQSLLQSQQGRKVQYENYREIKPNWKSIQNLSSSFAVIQKQHSYLSNTENHIDMYLSNNPFQNISFATLSRSVETSLSDKSNFQYDNRDANTKNKIVEQDKSRSSNKSDLLFGTFRIYKFILNDNIASSINRNISISEMEFKSEAGMSVSNKGGYHSITNYFMNAYSDSISSAIINDGITDNTTPVNTITLSKISPTKEIVIEKSIAQKLGIISSYAAQIAEQDDYQQSVIISNNNNKISTNKNSNKIRELQSVSESEAWININRHGDWNGLHTHYGSTWSGIYYAQSEPASYSKSYSGNLLLKTTPHITEKNVNLSEIDILRLNCCDTKNDLENQLKKIDKLIVNNDEIFVTKIINDNIVNSVENNDNMKYTAPNLSCCDYVEINAKAGVMYLIPSWLQHAVLPLAVKNELRNEPTGARISVAFNFQQL